MKAVILFSMGFLFLGMAIIATPNDVLNRFRKEVEVKTLQASTPSDSVQLSPNCRTFVEQVKWQSTQDVTYDPSYFTIAYPNGDVPANKGVCVEVPIRGLRSIGIDLQRLVHEDILAARSAYQITKVDKNIDHRRCTNLIVYFKRQKQTVPVSTEEADYLPGDIVFWDISRGHVGVVTDEKVPGTNRYYMVHNICCGPKMEDFLFAAPIVCHVRMEKLR
jgi:uncharacterized protein YijF (DUF1287 family)